jgi:amino acid adenylation domain-containing protein
MASTDSRTDRLAALSPERRALLEKRMRGAGAGSTPASGAIVPRRPGEPIPLSFAQRRLWFLDQLAPGNPFYNIPLNIRLTIPVNVPALQRAINEIVRRHESLRTTFASHDGEPVQLVAERVDVPMPIVDIRSMPTEERDDEARRLATLEAQLPFDLARGPLIRTTLVQLGDADFLLLLSIHHIVADGWSMGVFSRELSALYSSYALGWPASLPDLPIQYGDFAVWQRQWLAGAVLEEQLGYWKKTLADLPGLQLHTDRPRPPVQAFRGAYHPFALDRELSDAVRALARAHGVTLFMTLTAAFVALLHRYTAQADIVIGTPIANRTRRELEPIVGFFVNSLVLRTDVGGDPSFAELLARVRDVALGAYAHQDLPFEALVEHLQPARDPSRNPLFQVTFQLFTPQAEGTVAEGGTAAPIAIQRGTAIFDIAFTLIDAGGVLRGGFEYDTDLFEESTIARMGGHLVQLLSAAVASPGCRVSRLPLLTAREREQLVDWNATAAEFPERLLDELVADAASLDPDAIAIVAPEGQLCRRELESRASALAGWLQHQGVERGDLVALLLDRSIDMVVAMLASLKAGAAYLPLDPSYPPQRLAFMLRDSRARVVIRGDVSPPAPDDGDVTVVALEDRRDEIFSGLHPLRTVEGRSPDDLAYVIYTSGSTGQPKGVAIPHRAICNHMHWMQRRFPLDASDRVLQRTPFSFDASVWEFYAPLMGGARLVLAEPAGSKDPGYLVEAIRDHEVTVLQLVPSLLDMLLGVPGFDRGLPLRRVFCGGEPLTPQLVQRFHARSDASLCNLYGPTEAAIDSTFWVSPGAPSLGMVPIGRPIANAETYILDEHGEPAPIGVPGELHIGGAGLARGYLHRPDLTAQRFVPDPFRPGDGRRLYRTGDLARYRSDGQIEFLGRLDSQVKVRGYRIELGEIESALRQHPSVRDAVVVCRDGQDGDRRLAAYVVTRDDGAAAAPEASEAQVDRWRQVFDDTHDHHDPDDPRFNIVGWNSSYTGLPIPADEMRETVEATLARLGTLETRRVLEVGCGTGLLLLSLAPRCESYVGTDFSPVTLQGLAAVVRETGLGNVRLLLQAADDVAGLGAEQFDLVILNSVVQYFPDASYLVRVVRQLVPHVAPGGAIFIGDVRNLALLDALHVTIEMAQAAPDLTAPALRQRVDRRAAQEQELVLAPDFFAALAADVRGLGHVDTLLKRGRHHNELTRFRYDAVLHVGDGAGRPPAVWLDAWPQDGLAAEDLQARLAASPDGAIGFADVPNARVLGATRVVQSLERAGDSWTTARIEREAQSDGGVDPEFFHDVAASVGGVAHVQWAMSGRPDAVDVIVAAAAGASPAFPRRPVPRGGYAACANDPLQGAFVRNLAPDLRRHLLSMLPDYMVPATFTLIEQVPLAPNGKIDRGKLPSPDPARARHGAYVAPRSRIEERLARLWSEVLAVPQIGMRDNFFTELGGHSLLGTQLMARVRSAFAIDLPLSRLFAAPTVGELAVHVQSAIESQEQAARAGATTGEDDVLLAVNPADLSDVDLALITRAMQADQGDQAV